MSTDIAEVNENHAIANYDPTLSVEAVLERVRKITELMQKAMRPSVDYGIIPGTNSKPTLLKPGAEKLCVMFRLAPKYTTSKTFHPDGHLTVESTCQIYDLAENFLGEASTMCSTRESKYAWRQAQRTCPACGKQAIIKGKAEFGGGFVCWKKKDGCGTTFAENDKRITDQPVGRVANEDLADSYNTVLRIAEKRSLLAAVRLVTGSSALFDEPDVHHESEESAEVPADKWLDWIASKPALTQVNEYLGKIKGIKDKTERAHAWTLTKDYATARGWTLDEKNKVFTENGEPDMNEALAPWITWLASGPSCKAFNDGIRDDFAAVPQEYRETVQSLLTDYAMKNGYKKDSENGEWYLPVGGN